MHYSFEAYPLAYAAAALIIFGLPMTLLFLAAMKSIALSAGANHSPKSAPALRSQAVSVIVKPVIVKPKPIKYVRRRALRIEWVSLPVEKN